MREQTFECAQCGDVLPAVDLSKKSLRAGGKNLDAATTICSFCAGEIDPEPNIKIGLDLGRNDYERFILSGTFVDPGIKAAYLLSY